MRPMTPDDEARTVFEVHLDDELVEWLFELCQGCGSPPAAVIVSMLRDIRKDDLTTRDKPVTPPCGINLH